MKHHMIVCYITAQDNSLITNAENAQLKQFIINSLNSSKTEFDKHTIEK